MKLLVDGNEVALFPEQSVGIERSSPVLNDDADSFSYNFTVPTGPNQKALGFPGRLNRVGNLTGKQFVLKDQGLVVAKGEVGFDKVIRKDTAMYLKSGNTEFAKRMEGKKLSDFFMGVEWWFGALYSPASMNNKLEEWNNLNRNFMQDPTNITHVILPFQINGDTVLSTVNAATTESGEQKLGYPPGTQGVPKRIYCFQFSVAHLLNYIVQAAGYTVVKNDVFDSEWKRLLVFGKLLYLYSNNTFGLSINYNPELLYHKELVPGWDVNEFVDVVKKMLCLSIEFNDIQKTASIFFKKELFSNPIVKLENETVDWDHSEAEEADGFSLSYEGQDDNLATENDYDVLGSVYSVNDLPPPSEDYEDVVYHSTYRGRDYICVKEDDSYAWKRIGRLKEYKSGNGKNDYQIDAKVPYNIVKDGYMEIPYVNFTFDGKSALSDLGALFFMLYDGSRTVNDITYYLIHSDRYSLNETIDFGRSLTPEYLHGQVYSEFLQWDTYRKREFTKYLKMDLIAVLSLVWSKRYRIEEVVCILNRIRFDVPYRGLVELNGFTV